MGNGNLRIIAFYLAGNKLFIGGNGSTKGVDIFDSLHSGRAT